MELYIVRHGTTDWNAQKRFQGAQDIDLNEKGRILAAELGKRLDSEGLDFDCIYSSLLAAPTRQPALSVVIKLIRLSKISCLQKSALVVLKDFPMMTGLTQTIQENTFSQNLASTSRRREEKLSNLSASAQKNLFRQ